LEHTRWLRNVQSQSQGQVNLISGEDSFLNNQLEEFWKIESYSTTRPETKPLSLEDTRALKLIDSSISLMDGHYQMGLQWRDGNPVLPYNRPLAEAKLQYLKKRFRRDPELEVKYRDVIQECVDQGYARKLSQEEAAKVSSITWYIPHHPVRNLNKPDKSSPCCAKKALSMTAQDSERKYSPEVIRTFRRNFYVDDVLKSFPSTEQAVHLTSDLNKLLMRGGFRLTKFASNSRGVLQSISPELRANPQLD